MIAQFKPRPVVIAQQHSLPFGVVRLDETLTLENPQHMIELKCSRSVVSLVSELADDYAKRFKRVHRAKIERTLSMLLANLFYSGSNGKSLIYSRSTAKQRMVISVVDYLTDEQLVDSVIQPPNESGCCSYLVAMPELMTRLKIHKVRMAQGDKFEPLVLRDENKKSIGIVRLKKYTPRKYRALIKPVELHNRWWDNNLATVDKRPILPFIHRIFNRSTDLGGRFYGHYQNMPSQDRRRILFNGKPTVEVDFDAFHVAILYAWAGVEMLGYPYDFGGYDPKVVKAIMLRLVNVKNISSLEGVITNSAKAERQEEVRRYKSERQYFELRASKGLKVGQPKPPEWLDSFIHGVPVGFDAKQFIADLMKRHSAISHLLGGDDLGLRLQAADSRLMGNIMADLYDRKNPVPVLPVHDSLRARATNGKLVELTMKHHFYLMFNAQIATKTT